MYLMAQSLHWKYYLHIDNTTRCVWLPNSNNDKETSDLDQWIELCMQENGKVHTPIDISLFLLNPAELYFNQSKEAFGM